MKRKKTSEELLTKIKSSCANVYYFFELSDLNLGEHPFLVILSLNAAISVIS